MIDVLRWQSMTASARRDFCIGLMAALLLRGTPAVAQADSPTLAVLAPSLFNPYIRALFNHLRELGYEDGRTVRVVVRSADAKLERLHASEIIGG